MLIFCCQLAVFLQLKVMILIHHLLHHGKDYSVKLFDAIGGEKW